MASVNKVIIVGNLGRDPEIRTFPSGDQVANVTIATTDRWKDKQSGEMKEATEWHRVVFNGRLAEIAGQYLRKGSQVYVEGSLRTRKWTDQSGVEKYSTEIRADQMQMLGSRQDGGDGGQQRQQGGGRGDGGYGRNDNGYGRDDGARQQHQPSQGQQRQQQQPQQRQQQQRDNGQGGYTGRNGGDSGFSDMDDDIPFISSSFGFDAESKLDRRIRRSNRTRRD